MSLFIVDWRAQFLLKELFEKSVYMCRSLWVPAVLPARVA